MGKLDSSLLWQKMSLAPFASPSLPLVLIQSSVMHVYKQLALARLQFAICLTMLPVSLLLMRGHRARARLSVALHSLTPSIIEVFSTIPLQSI